MAESVDNMERISEFTIRRLSNYYRLLSDLESHGILTVASARLAEMGGVTPAQVRKDLSYFGNFGTRGLGYKVNELKDAIERILGLHKNWAIALFGAGFLGHALVFHQGFRDDGFFFKYIFDVDEKKIGTEWNDIFIRPLSEAEGLLADGAVDIAVISTPREAAQTTIDLVVRMGIKGILNFAPVQLTAPDGVWIRNVNLAVALESLSFYLSN